MSVPPPGCVTAAVGVLLAAVVWTTSVGLERQLVTAGFWFEAGPFTSDMLDQPITAEELATIQAVAMAELHRAFADLPIRFTNSREGRYRVRVVQDVRDERFRREVRVAGQSRGIAGFGGQGSVSFSFLAGSAVAYAPEGVNRAALIEAMGRGIGRAAVHEFAHQLLPSAGLHATRDRASYEYYSAGRVEQYFGDMHWDIAWPLLRQRLAR